MGECSHKGLYHERFEGGEELVAVVGGDLEHDGLVEVEAEDAEDGLCVHDIPAALQSEVEVAAGGDVDKLLDGFRGVQFDLNGFHETDLLKNFFINGIISETRARVKKITGQFVPSARINARFDRRKCGLLSAVPRGIMKKTLRSGYGI